MNKREIRQTLNRLRTWQTSEDVRHLREWLNAHALQTLKEPQHGGDVDAFFRALRRANKDAELPAAYWGIL